MTLVAFLAILLSLRTSLSDSMAVKLVAQELVVVQTAPTGSLLVQALDYRAIVRTVYRPNNFSVCVPASDTPQCWLQLSTTVQCQDLFKEYLQLLEQHQPVFPPPRGIRMQDKATFLLNGFTTFRNLYIQQQDYAPDADIPVWNQAMLDAWMHKVKLRQPVGHYFTDSLSIYQALDCHPVKGSTGAVFGTEVPWLEAILFAYGELL